jgi:hypothetical protein
VPEEFGASSNFQRGQRQLNGRGRALVLFQQLNSGPRISPQGKLLIKTHPSKETVENMPKSFLFQIGLLIFIHLF